MARQFSESVRNAMVDSYEATIGSSPKLQVRTGAPPANTAAADTGTLLCEISLPSDWLSAGSGGSKSKLGTWTGTAVAAGTAGHFRLKNTAGSTTHDQGTITATGGGGDMTVDNTSVAISQPITANSFSITQGNA